MFRLQRFSFQRPDFLRIGIPDLNAQSGGGAGRLLSKCAADDIHRAIFLRGNPQGGLHGGFGPIMDSYRFSGSLVCHLRYVQRKSFINNILK